MFFLTVNENLLNRLRSFLDFLFEVERFLSVRSERGKKPLGLELENVASLCTN